MIGIIDYRMGNLRSVQKAFEKVGADAIILSGPDDAHKVDRLVLPGVGAFADGMAHLNEAGWPDAIRQFVSAGNPFLGVCLGMQLLLDGSEEDAPSDAELVPGLGLLSGNVRLFCGEQFGAGKLKVPHMGWNGVKPRTNARLFSGIQEGDCVYFVHGYYAADVAENDIAATTDYGFEFCSSVHRDNIWATQFHPEKSQNVGLRMLENFTRL